MGGSQSSKQAVAVRPVPAPPKRPLPPPRAVSDAPAAKGREHEVRRLIRDLAEMAANRQGRTA